MSDYLSRLIQRSRGVAPEIEPLIAPLHAPSDQLEERMEPSVEIAPGPPAETHSASDATTRGDVRKGPTAAPNKGARVSPEFRATDGEALPLFPPPKPRPEFPPEKRGEQGGPKESRLPTQLQPLPSRSDSQPSAAESRPVPPAIEPRGPDPDVVAPPTTEHLASVTASRGVGPTRIVVQPPVSRHAPPASSAAFTRHSSSNEPPAIHVTIGRVEVRAIMAQPEPPKRSAPPPATPRISLEEYLKQRNGDRS
jgi:hypothetical protein